MILNLKVTDNGNTWYNLTDTQSYGTRTRYQHRNQMAFLNLSYVIKMLCWFEFMLK